MKKLSRTTPSLYMILFVIFFILFSIAYFSFFPGRYSPDSYTMYSIALGDWRAIDALSPLFGIFWKIGGDYNYSPLIINYLLLLISFMLMYRHLKSMLLPLLIIICFVSPFFLSSYIFIWKDNALLSVLLLLTSVLIQDKSKHPVLYCFIISILLILATSLRLNAIFAVLPLIWFYINNHVFSHDSKSYKKLIGFLIAVLLIMTINHIITYRVFNAYHSTYIQQLYATDIAKINHALGENIDVPVPFTQNLNKNNVEQLFKQYYRYKSNDYFYYQLLDQFKPILKSIDDWDYVNALRSIWLKKIIAHPLTYTKNRYEQWISAIKNINNIYNENFNPHALYHAEHHADLIYYESNHPLITSIREHYHLKPSKLHDILYFLSIPIIYLILNIVGLSYLLLKKKKTPYRQLILTILLSGIFYGLGYLPILPSGDYRYFTWVILSFWISLGLYLHE